MGSAGKQAGRRQADVQEGKQADRQARRQASSLLAGSRWAPCGLPKQSQHHDVGKEYDLLAGRCFSDRSPQDDDQNPMVRDR